MKKWMNKKDNKGFSLVELIVVILIMAIIAVALAPQVMRWVENSRISTDDQTEESLKSAVQMALTDEDAYNDAIEAGASIYVYCDNTGTGVYSNAAHTAPVTSSTVHGQEFLAALIVVASDYAEMSMQQDGWEILISIIPPTTGQEGPQVTVTRQATPTV